eukprot:68247_1
MMHNLHRKLNTNEAHYQNNRILSINLFQDMAPDILSYLFTFLSFRYSNEQCIQIELITMERLNSSILKVARLPCSLFELNKDDHFNMCYHLCIFNGNKYPHHWIFQKNPLQYFHRYSHIHKLTINFPWLSHKDQKHFLTYMLITVAKNIEYLNIELFYKRHKVERYLDNKYISANNYFNKLKQLKLLNFQAHDFNKLITRIPNRGSLLRIFETEFLYDTCVSVICKLNTLNYQQWLPSLSSSISVITEFEKIIQTKHYSDSTEESLMYYCPHFFRNVEHKWSPEWCNEARNITLWKNQLFQKFNYEYKEQNCRNSLEELTCIISNNIVESDITIYSLLCLLHFNCKSLRKLQVTAVFFDRAPYLIDSIFDKSIMRLNNLNELVINTYFFKECKKESQLKFILAPNIDKICVEFRGMHCMFKYKNYIDFLLFRQLKINANKLTCIELKFAEVGIEDYILDDENHDAPYNEDYNHIAKILQGLNMTLDKLSNLKLLKIGVDVYDTVKTQDKALIIQTLIGVSRYTVAKQIAVKIKVVALLEKDSLLEHNLNDLKMSIPWNEATVETLKNTEFLDDDEDIIGIQYLFIAENTN